MYMRWVVEGDYHMPQIDAPASPERVIKIGTTGLAEPYSFCQGTELTGYDIELIKRLAVWANASIDISAYN